jgi:hypothetical protein
MSQLLELVKPEEYFRSKIHAALASLHFELDDQIEYYLVNLLCDFISPNKSSGSEPFDVLGTPLAMMLKSAIESDPDSRVKIYKRLGDTSLYFAGFFQEYFNRRPIDVNYYITMGTTAYERLSEVIKTRHNDTSFTLMYRDLAKGFRNLVEIIATVSQELQHKSDVNILATYERWTKTNSQRLRKILEDEGIDPVSINFKLAQ